MRRLVLGLNAATVLLVVAGIAFLAIPTPMPAGRGAVMSSPGTLPDSGRPAPVADLGAAERVVRTDIFSSRRAAPPRRYSLGEGTPESDGTPTEMTVAPPLAGEPMDSTTASTANDPVPRLYGTMLGPTESTALLRLDARISEPRLYRVGDRAGGYRVTEISDRSVALVGASGRLVLRLATPDQ
jgi:hypothetical protein